MLVEKDLAHVWHPFTQAQTASPPIPIIKAQGAYLYSADGTRYLDAISSWWVNLHGHTHPYIVKHITKQAHTLEHVLFAGCTHPPAIELASRLLSLLPGSFSKIFYSDNGSTAVEVAIKMALQYTSKPNIICFRNSYHGDTFGAMSVSGKNTFNKPFWSHLFQVSQIDPPLKHNEKKSLSQLQRIIERKHNACFIFEPLVLGSGGMIMYPQNGLNALISLCKEHDILTIGDEVMTGFGRTGTLFASETLTTPPDIICLSKGITGGFLPLGATACSQKLFDAFLGESLSQAFLHGHSYTANPIACASALASLDLLEQKKCTLQRDLIASCHKNFCSLWAEHKNLVRCESSGTILALEYRVERPSYFQPLRDKLYNYFLDQGILLRPLGNVLYILPPYCIQKEELEFIYKHIAFTLENPL